MIINHSSINATDQVVSVIISEDAIQFLLKTYGWDIARHFAVIHNLIVRKKDYQPPFTYSRGNTGNPLYTKEALAGWAETKKRD